MTGLSSMPEGDGCYIPWMGAQDKRAVEPPESEENSVDEFFRLPTTLPDIGIDLRNFATEDHAKRVGEAVNSYLHVFGRVLNLKRLLKVIVAYDYGEALAGIERGTASSKPLKATNDDIAVGIAMAPAILHDGEPRSVMVLNAVYMSALAESENPELEAIRDQMAYTLAHECAHVHDLEMQTRGFPDAMLKTQLPFRDAILFGIASACWDEYIACRLSAFIAKETTLRAYEDTFCKALEAVKGRADAAIRQYRMHHDVRRVTDEVSREYKKVMVYASYLLGQVDGLDRPLDDVALKALDALAHRPYFKPFFSKLHAELRTLHGAYGDWKSLEVFEPLKQLAYELLRIGGLTFKIGPTARDMSIFLSVRRQFPPRKNKRLS
jgi:hypothetical protein